MNMQLGGRMFALNWSIYKRNLILASNEQNFQVTNLKHLSTWLTITHGINTKVVLLSDLWSLTQYPCWDTSSSCPLEYLKSLKHKSQLLIFFFHEDSTNTCTLLVPSPDKEGWRKTSNACMYNKILAVNWIMA